MMDDTITQLLRGVADGSVKVEDARTALEGAEMSEEQMNSDIDNGDFNVIHMKEQAYSFATSGGNTFMGLIDMGSEISVLDKNDNKEGV